MTTNNNIANQQRGDGLWMKFGNNKIWFVGSDSWIEGVVRVPGYENIHDSEDRIDAVSEAVTGSTCGLTGFTRTYLGGDMVKFEGSVEYLLKSEDEEILPNEIDVNSKEFVIFTAFQYGISQMEAEHMVSSLDDTHADEVVVQLAKGRELRCPTYPSECCYARICVGGLEVAYWHMDSWRKAPGDVMGALIGAMIGSERRVAA